MTLTFLNAFPCSFLNDDKRFVRHVDVSLQIYSTLLRNILLFQIFLYKSYYQGICYLWKVFFGFFYAFFYEVELFLWNSTRYLFRHFFLRKNLVLYWLYLWILQYVIFFSLPVLYGRNFYHNQNFYEKNWRECFRCFCSNFGRTILPGYSRKISYSLIKS